MANILKLIPEYEGELISSAPSSSESLFCVGTFRVALTSAEDVNTWLSLFEERTKTQWIVHTGTSGNKSKTNPTAFVVNRDYVCHHSWTRKVKTSKKACGCSASLSIRVKKQSRFVDYRDEYAKMGLYGVVTLNNVHNHLIDNSEALRWLRRTDETTEIFIAHFNEGKSPAEAYQLHQDLIVLDDVCKLADSSVNPPQKWIYLLHDRWRKRQFGDVNVTADFMSVARKRIAGLEEEGFKVVMQEEPFSLSVCSPLMQRALLADTNPRSMFIDTSSSCDQLNTSLTIVMVATKTGAVPVGFTLHSSQDTESYTAAFRQLQSLWCSLCDSVNIENFMADDSRAMKSALSSVWPHVRQYLCVFHVMQAQWRWLCDGKNGVPKESRRGVMEAFSKVLYSDNQEMAGASMSSMIVANADIDDADHRNRVSSHMEALWERREEWCLAFRTALTRGNNTNNYSEATFRLIKDTILCRLKSYNPLALLDYLVRVLEKYYQVRLLNVAFGRKRKNDLVCERIKKLAEPIVAMVNGVERISDSLFHVRSANSEYVYDVHFDVGKCTCYVGRQGAYCKHQSAVAIKYGLEFKYCPGISAADKTEIFSIATGRSPPADFLKSMQDIDIAPTTSSNSVNEICIRSEDPDEQLPDERLPDEQLPDEQLPDVPDEQLKVTDPAMSEMDFEYQRIKTILNKNRSDPTASAVTAKIIQDWRKITTLAHIYDYSMIRSPYSLFRRRKIPVQPTSVSRRVAGVSRGSGRRRAGRPLAVVAAARRRALQQRHSLAQSIAANRPSAKSHGDGH